MNKEEFKNFGNRFNTPIYKSIHDKLRAWKELNGITERCVVHHRDDTEECRKYNEEHYELWGFNLDGTFEYGKYVIFMTASDHTKYHHTGNAIIGKLISNALIGRIGSMTNHKHTEDAKHKMSVAHKGMKHSTATREKMERTRQQYHLYKSLGGDLKWNDFQKLVHNNAPQILQYLDK